MLPQKASFPVTNQPRSSCLKAGIRPQNMTRHQMMRKMLQQTAMPILGQLLNFGRSAQARATNDTSLGVLGVCDKVPRRDAVEVLHRQCTDFATAQRSSPPDWATAEARRDQDILNQLFGVLEAMNAQKAATPNINLNRLIDLVINHLLNDLFT